MLRDHKEIRRHVVDFFKSKDSQVECALGGDEFTIRATLHKGEVEHAFSIRNKFFRKDGGWEELTDHLEEQYLELAAKVSGSVEGEEDA